MGLQQYKEDLVVLPLFEMLQSQSAQRKYKTATEEIEYFDPKTVGTVSDDEECSTIA